MSFVEASVAQGDQVNDLPLEAAKRKELANRAMQFFTLRTKGSIAGLSVPPNGSGVRDLLGVLHRSAADSVRENAGIAGSRQCSAVPGMCGIEDTRCSAETAPCCSSS